MKKYMLVIYEIDIKTKILILKNQLSIQDFEN